MVTEAMTYAAIILTQFVWNDWDPWSKSFDVQTHVCEIKIPFYIW